MVGDELFDAFVFVIIFSVVEFDEGKGFSLAPLVPEVDISPFSLVVANDHFLVFG